MPDVSLTASLAAPATMACARSPMRYAHSDGHTDLCYTEDGLTLITCGSDGDVRLWADLEDDDPTSKCVGENAFAVAVQGQRLLVGTDSHSVQAYTLPALERDGIVTRFTAHVTHISVSNEHIAAASKDMEIHVVTVATKEMRVIAGHTGPVLGVALDPLGLFLASSSGDGSARVWRLSDGVQVARWEVCPPCIALAQSSALGRCSWAPDGLALAVPRGNGQLALVSRDDWTDLHLLNDTACADPVSITAFSACGRLLAAGSSRGHVSVWRLRDRALVASSPHARSTPITALSWGTALQIALCDCRGQLGTIDLDPKVFGETHEPTRAPVPVPKLLERDLDDDIFELEPRAVSPGLDDMDVTSVIGSERAVSRVESRLEVRDETQPAFQPGSTPEHLQHRYLAWNGAGVVRAQSTESERSLEVELHDSSIHHALRIRNELAHTLAALTEHALALAGPAGEDQTSQLEVRLWAGGEWRLALAQGEEAVALAAGSSFVALATDCRQLRILALHGGQREVLALPGALVALAAHRDRLAVVCNVAAGTGSGPALGVSLIRVSAGGVACGGAWQPLALAPNATLQWLGFSDEGAACAVDSAGILRLRGANDGWWRQVADLSTHVRGVSDHVFVVGVSERYANVRGVVCRGSRYPATSPRPAVQELPLQIPLCEASLEQTALEQGYLLRLLVMPSLSTETDFDSELAANQASQDEALLKLFAMAVRGGVEGRALALVALMTAQLRALAAKYAVKVGKFALADRIERAAPIVEPSDPEPLSPSNASPSSTATEPSLLAAAASTPRVEVRPSLVLSGAKGPNPFKRATPLTRVPGSGLAQLEQKARRVPAAIVTATKQPVKALRQSALAPVAVPFAKWFSSRRDALAAEHPDASAAELCKLATERYKAENKASAAAGKNLPGPAETKPGQAETTENGDGAETERNGQAQEAASERIDVELAAETDEDVVESSQAAELFSRKRKLDAPEPKPASKLTSKMTAFAYLKKP